MGCIEWRVTIEAIQGKLARSIVVAISGETPARADFPGQSVAGTIAGYRSEVTQ